MIYLAYFIFLFSMVQLLVALVNLLFKQSFSKTRKEFNGLVSILIPARNEEKNIGNLLKDIQNQDYTNIEVIVFNDQSSDKTANIVQDFSKSDQRIKLINSEILPNGWLGKNYACHALSNHAKGEYYLFLDADVRISNDIIFNTINKAEKLKLGLLSIFPKQVLVTVGEWITVPNMNYILLSLLPLVLIYKLKFSSIAAANGQFMLFNSAVYHQTLPHEKMKANKVEDIEIARYFKMNKIQTTCLTGNNTITCRMYQGFNEAVNGFSKNVVNFFGNSFVVAVLFWLITTFGFILVIFSLSNSILTIYLISILTTRILISKVSRQNILLNILLIVPQQLTLGLFIFKALTNKFKKQYQWKGRNIS